MKKLLPLAAIVLASCASYTPPAVSDKAPKAQISFTNSNDMIVNIAVDQTCQPRVAFGNPSILVLSNQFHGTNGNKEKKIQASQFSAAVEANKTHVVSPAKSYPGDTTYTWVNTGTAPIRIPVTQLKFCDLKSYKWTPQADHKYQLITNKTGNNVCDIETKLVDLAQPNTNLATETAGLCD